MPRPPTGDPECSAGARRRRALAASLIVGGALLIGALTLPSEPVPARGGPSYSLWCLLCGDFGGVDATLNILLFVPFGLGLGLAGMRTRRALLVVVTTTVVVEGLQLMVLRGRDPSLSDVLTNTLGGALGLLLAARWRTLLFPSRRIARRLAALGFVLWIGERMLSAWLLQPSLPATAWFAQVAPEDVYPANFRGRVESAEIAQRPASPRQMDTAWTDRLRRSLHVAARVRAPEATHALASIVGVLDAERTEIIVLAQEGRAARFRVRLRVADALLRVPSIRLAEAFPADSLPSVDLSGEARPGELRLRARSAGGERVETLRLGAGLGWSFFLPSDWGLTAEVRWISATCTGLLLALLGYYSARGASLSGEWLTLGAAVTTGLLGLSAPGWLFTLAGADLPELSVGLAGLLVGFSVGRRTRAKEAAELRGMPTSPWRDDP